MHQTQNLCVCIDLTLVKLNVLVKPTDIINTNKPVLVKPQYFLIQNILKSTSGFLEKDSRRCTVMYPGKKLYAFREDFMVRL